MAEKNDDRVMNAMGWMVVALGFAIVPFLLGAAALLWREIL